MHGKISIFLKKIFFLVPEPKLYISLIWGSKLRLFKHNFKKKIIFKVIVDEKSENLDFGKIFFCSDRKENLGAYIKNIQTNIKKKFQSYNRWLIRKFGQRNWFKRLSMAIKKKVANIPSRNFNRKKSLTERHWSRN